MDETALINEIKQVVGSKYLGDDCAYLKDKGIVVTQDSLIEGIHFKKEWYTPFQLGYKAVAVNISDILASGAKPQYLTIALSIPSNICNSWAKESCPVNGEDFIRNFYQGAVSASCGAEIVGGDITGSKNDLAISITAIGDTTGRNISSRSNAKEGYAVITKGLYGSSSAGLSELIKNRTDSEVVKSHLTPILDVDFSRNISEHITVDYAMMDTSDGLADALYKIAEASNVKIVVDYAKIPHLDNIKKEQILFGGEDYNLLACVPQDFANNLNDGVIIGDVVSYDGVRISISGEGYCSYNDLNVFKHFE